jgi:hypothetical protein
MRLAADVAQAHPRANFPAVSAPAVRTSVDVHVRYSETDRMGVACHTHYLRWAELGLTEHLLRHGVRYPDLEERGHLLAAAWTSLVSLSVDGRATRLPDAALAAMRPLAVPSDPEGSNP